MRPASLAALRAFASRCARICLGVPNLFRLTEKLNGRGTVVFFFRIFGSTVDWPTTEAAAAAGGGGGRFSIRFFRALLKDLDDLLGKFSFCSRARGDTSSLRFSLIEESEKLEERREVEALVVVPPPVSA